MSRVLHPPSRILSSELNATATYQQHGDHAFATIATGGYSASEAADLQEHADDVIDAFMNDHSHTYVRIPINQYCVSWPMPCYHYPSQHVEGMAVATPQINNEFAAEPPYNLLSNAMWNQRHGIHHTFL